MSPSTGRFCEVSHTNQGILGLGLRPTGRVLGPRNALGVTAGRSWAAPQTGELVAGIAIGPVRRLIGRGQRKVLQDPRAPPRVI